MAETPTKTTEKPTTAKPAAEKPATEPAGRGTAVTKKNLSVVMLIPAMLIMGVISFGVSFLLFQPDDAPRQAAPPPQSDTPTPPVRLGALPEDRGAYAEKIADVEVNFDELTRQQNARKTALDQRETQLRLQENRLAEEAARLKQDIAALESVQIQTLDALRKVHEAKDALDNSRVVIAREEKANLKLLVAKYDTMSTTQAGEIFYNMCTSGKEDDVVRILYTMKERSAAKILAEMTGKPDKTISARLTEKLLRVRDQQGST